MLQRALPYIVLATVLFLPFSGYAQQVTGDPLGGLVFWVYSTLGRSIIMLAFMVVGLVMIAGRHTFEALIFAALGVGFWVGAPTIADAVANQLH